jgi:hypothetical protein
MTGGEGSEEALATVTTAYAPAYAMGGSEGAGSGPQCSSFPEDYCFFCQCESTAEGEQGESADLYGSLAGLVHSMTENNKEFPHVVQKVHYAYETSIRPLLGMTSSHGPTPAWSKRAIARHLTYSIQFKPLFRASVTQMLHSIIDGHNRKMFDANTNEVNEPERMGLMSTLNMFMKWERFHGGK